MNIYLATVHFLRFLWVIFNERPDIVYTPIAQSTLGYLRDCLFLVPARILGKKVVIHLHGGYFKNFYDESSSLMKALIRYSLGGVRRAIVLGENLKPIFDGLVPSERIAVVPNGIDENGFDTIAVTDSALNSGKRRPRILFLGSLVKSKGFATLLGIMPSVLEKVGDVECIFAGEFRSDAEREQTMSLVEQNNLSGCVSFVGLVVGEDKARLLLSSDLFILPTRSTEGQPLVLLEAMAAGLPAICTDVGAIRETVINGETGFIVEKQDTRQLAERILILLEDAQLRREMGKRSRERFLECYTKDRFADNLGEVFEGVLSELR
jgi:glycosyltransferase involved in cell wall biosynthesis